MKSEKLIFWCFAVFAAIVLGAAAVWLGGLNQDEGWYLYAANLVAEGKIPYVDFAYTQGPVMPIVYSAFAGVWRQWGLLGARILTLAIGLFGICLAALTARRMAGSAAALVVFLLLGGNLYHLYYLAIPKTYALAALFVSVGFYCLTFLRDRRAVMRVSAAVVSGAALALAAGTRISLGAILAVVGCWLLYAGFRKNPSVPRWSFLWFGLGGITVLAVVYGGFFLSPAAREGLLAAQKYHATRGGFDPVFTVGSLSRLFRWYLPVFIVLGLGVAGAVGRERKSRSGNPLFLSFLAVFLVQMLAPFPYEDYQVPIMGLLAVSAAVSFVTNLQPSIFNRLLVLGLAYACSFGSPLLEKWMTNGQDRFWSLKKGACELAQLRDVARRIENLDPQGRTLLTQDLYLAIETNRKVPRGLEMGPFAILSDDEWKKLLSETAPAECALAALSGYTFAIEPPTCNERPIERQMEYWGLLKKNFKLVDREECFGQNATPLLVLKRKRPE